MVNLYPFTDDRGLGRDPGRVRRADRHRRPVDGPGRGEEPPVGRGRDRRRRATTRVLEAVRRRRVHASPSGSALAAAAFAHTAAYDVAVASWMGSVLAPTRSEGPASRRWSGATWEQAGDAALRREPAPGARRSTRDPAAAAGWPARSSCTARRCPTTTTSTPTPRCRAAYDFDGPAVAIIKHANPCGIAVGADVAEAHRKAHACDPVSAFGGVIATNGAVSRGDGRAGRRGLHRGDRRAGLRRRRGRGAGPQEEHPAPRRRAGPPPGGGRAPTDQRRPAAAGEPVDRRRRRRGRPGRLDAGLRRAGARDEGWPTSRSPGARAGR